MCILLVCVEMRAEDIQSALKGISRTDAGSALTPLAAPKVSYGALGLLNGALRLPLISRCKKRCHLIQWCVVKYPSASM